MFLKNWGFGLQEERDWWVRGSTNDFTQEGAQAPSADHHNDAAGKGSDQFNHDRLPRPYQLITTTRRHVMGQTRVGNSLFRSSLFCSKSSIKSDHERIALITLYKRVMGAFALRKELIAYLLFRLKIEQFTQKPKS